MTHICPKCFRWFHGDNAERNTFLDQRWDRDRTTASLNEYGPGIYFTSKFSEAASYGPYVYEAQLKDSFRLLSAKKRVTWAPLLAMFRAANDYDKQLFLDNWNTRSVRKALSHYMHQRSLFDALFSLYGELIRRADEWVDALVNVVGYDGVIIDRGSWGTERKHLVLWNPRAVNIVSVYDAVDDLYAEDE